MSYLAVSVLQPPPRPPDALRPIRGAKKRITPRSLQPAARADVKKCVMPIVRSLPKHDNSSQILSLILKLITYIYQKETYVISNSYSILTRVLRLLEGR